MNDAIRGPDRSPTDEMGPDPRLGEALRVLDPETRWPGYWRRFRGQVMTAARDELARRRMLADVTVSELLASWGRVLVPTAAIAAAAAAALLLGPAPESVDRSPLPVAFEEVIGAELGDVPGFTPTPPDQGVMFASDGF